MKRHVVALAVVLLASCRDEAAEAFVRAELKYQSLLSQSARPDDARFDAVLADLRKVSPTSKHFEAAQQLLRAIEGGRIRVRTPLALAPSGRRPLALEAQLQACARLAIMTGQDGGVDARAREALDECRQKAEKLEHELEHD